MQRIRTFKDIVKKTFFDEIENRISLYVERNFNEMDFHSHKVDTVDEVHVQEQELHRTVVYDSIGDALAFDAIVIAEIDIYQASRHKDLDDTVRKWFRVSCEVEVIDGFHNFKIINVDDEYDHHVNDQKDRLDDNLIPIIGAADIERHAEEILSHVYPEALNTPMRVDVEKFAERLDLKIVRKHLSRNGSIFGQMIFHPTSVDYYDLDKHGFSTYEADSGTIFADDEIFFLRSLGSWNNTIIHECVHWLKHRKHIELKRAAGDHASRISCQVTEMPPETKKRKRNDTEWMEWHANALAPRILMPRQPFKEKAEELISWHMKNSGTERLSDILPAVIMELSQFFEVSILSIRIRLMDVGYSEAVGALEYVDGQYVPTHSFASGAIGERQTFTVPMKEGLIQYAANPAFKAVIDNGDFVYIDGHYVINAPKYVVSNSFGIIEMTDYALANMDECCLSFERSTRSNPEYNVQRYTECILYQSATSKTITDFVFSNTDNDKKVIKNAAAIRAELEEARSADKLMAELPGSFGKSLVMIMTWRKITVEKLAEASLLDTRMIQRMRNDNEQAWSIRRMVALCIGLKLPPYMSFHLIEKAGLTFKHGEEQITLRHILSTRYNSTIHECNDLLAEAGYPPLSQDD
jgi:hypothetical protein